jgi:DNA-binding XRE family transcriptional regulator
MISPVKEYRVRAGLTKSQAARACGLTPQGWNNLEEKGANPRLSTLKKVCKVLGSNQEETRDLINRI